MEWKLRFLKRQLAEGAVGVAAVAMRSLLDDPNSLCLVGECRELEEHFGTNYTRMLAYHDHGSKLCPLCDEINLDPNPIGHLFESASA